MDRGIRAGSVACLTLAFSVLAALPAAQASAATKIIPVKVKLTGISGDDLIGELESKSPKCAGGRVVKLSGDSSDSAETGPEGEFAFVEGNLYQEGSWTAKAGKSKKFGKPGKRKQCGADTASYEYAAEEATITLSFAPATGGTGSVTWPDDICVGSGVELRHNNGVVESTTEDLDDGSYSFAASLFSDPGTYTVTGPGTVILDPHPNGNLEIDECYGTSPPVVVAH